MMLCRLPDLLAPDLLAPDRLAPDRLAPDRLAPDRLAPDRLAPPGLAARRPAAGLGAVPTLRPPSASPESRVTGGRTWLSAAAEKIDSAGAGCGGAASGGAATGGAASGGAASGGADCGDADCGGGAVWADPNGTGCAALALRPPVRAFLASVRVLRPSVRAFLASLRGSRPGPAGWAGAAGLPSAERWRTGPVSPVCDPQSRSVRAGAHLSDSRPSSMASQDWVTVASADGSLTASAEYPGSASSPRARP